MKNALLMLGFSLISLASYSQEKIKISDYIVEYPIDDIKDSYDDNLNHIYNLKLLNRTKKTITNIVFYLAPPYDEQNDTNLSRTLRAQQSIAIPLKIILKPGYTISYLLHSPDNSRIFAVDVEMVRYSDGSYKKFKSIRF